MHMEKSNGETNKSHSCFVRRLMSAIFLVGCVILVVLMSVGMIVRINHYTGHDQLLNLQIIDNMANFYSIHRGLRWTPGKEGGLEKYKSIADKAQSLFISDTETSNRASTPVSLQQPITTSADVNVDEVEMRPAKLKRKYRQEQLQKQVGKQQQTKQNRGSPTSLSAIKNTQHSADGSVTNTELSVVTPAAKTVELDTNTDGERLSDDAIAAAAIVPSSLTNTTATTTASLLSSVMTDKSTAASSTSSSAQATVDTTKTTGATGTTSTEATKDITTSTALNATSPRVSSTPNPFIPYHSQASSIDYAKYKAYIPSLDVVSAQRTSAGMAPLPNLSKQKGVHEKDNLKLHLCNEQFEAYSASYLTTRQHMLAVTKPDNYNLSMVNCEMASFFYMSQSKSPVFYATPQAAEGMIMQSLDVLDFSVIHLSAYERSSKKYRYQLWPGNNEEEMKTEWSKIDPVKKAAIRLSELNNPQLKTSRKIKYSPEAKRTVVIMPFLGGEGGAGHSELENRFEYLKACFWSFYEFVPNIVAGVTRQADVDWCMKKSGLPFYDVILLPDLPKPAGLPVGLTVQTKERLKDGRYDFDYVFFTESDQILISRELPLMYEHLKKYPGHMMLPHRLMPYSHRVATEIHKRDTTVIRENRWMDQSCCLPRQNCQERRTWVSVKDQNLPFINYYGLYVPLGNVNFLDEKFRACKLGDYIGDYCP